MLKKINAGAEYGVLRVTVEHEKALELLFIQRFNLSPLRANELICLGATYINEQRVLNPDEPIYFGDKVRLHSRPRRFQAGDLASRIREETKEYLIVDKPSGLPVHGLVDNLRENLISFLENLLQTKLFITHRLDIETSGLLLIAKNPTAQKGINSWLAQRKISRTYSALVTQPIDCKTYIHFMEPSPKAPKRVEAEPRQDWLKCELQVLNCEQAPNYAGEWTFSEEKQNIFKLKIQLGTGRPQQIRAQLAALGAPILGDLKYGSETHVSDRNTGSPAIALRAELLELPRESLEVVPLLTLA